MIKTILRTLIILLIAAALGWGTWLLIQRSPQASAAGGFGGERPAFSDDARPNPPAGFRGAEGGFEGREGFGAIGNLVSVLTHLILFAVATFLVVVLGKILPKKPKTIEADS